MNDESHILSQISTLGKQILPEGSRLYLYGSRARGDARPDSDWDLLILLNKKREPNDFDRFAYPFVELGFEYDMAFKPHYYTLEEWEKYSFTPFHHNVEQDKIILV